MRLRKISAVILYGRILHARGQLDLSRTLLAEAGFEAEKRGYQLKAEVVDRISREIFP